MPIKIALAGNPNSGKTTLFNALTGSNQFVGNWPGVTVEKKEGKLIDSPDCTLVDLPGIYSISPYTLEEVVSRNYLLDEKPNAIINIIDGSNLERNLYLTTQLLDLEIPMVIAINMMDVVKKSGDRLDIAALSEMLSCEVVEITALKNEGIELLSKTAQRLANSGKAAPSIRFSSPVEDTLRFIKEELLSEQKGQFERFFAIKLFERDKKIIKRLKISKLSSAKLDEKIKACEAKVGDDAESIMTNERYEYVTKVTADCYQKRVNGKPSVTDRIDRIVTNKFLALPIFAAVMFVVYFISVTTIGQLATDWMNDGVFGEGFGLFGLHIPGIPVLIEGGLNAIGCADWLKSLILDGIVSGVGAVLGFVPQMLVLFLFLAFLEACGYMSRIAFIMDRIFKKFGLSGKSFIPMLIGTGCGVPGIMASRTIENAADRKMTIITTTFIPCGAKLPIIALIAGALFGGAWWVAPAAYFIGIAAVMLSGIILKKTKLFASDTAPFIMELPPYHLPTVQNLLRSMWERGWSFIKKAGTVILLATVVIWFASSFGFENGSFGMVSMENSILAYIGKLLAPIFAPLGFGSWQASVATLTGIAAKENVVGTLAVLMGGEGNAAVYQNIATIFTPIAALSFMTFNLLCAPCAAAMGAIKREMNNGKWTMFAIGYQCGFAYCIALILYNFSALFFYGSFTGYTVAAIAIFLLFIWLIARKGYGERRKAYA